MDLSVAEYQLLQKYALHVKVGRCRTCVQTVKDHWLTLLFYLPSQLVLREPANEPLRFVRSTSKLTGSSESAARIGSRIGGPGYLS